MAEPEEKKEQSQPDKTIGKKDAPDTNNGAPSQENMNEEVEQAANDIAERYAKAKREINESVNRLRYEMEQFDAAEARNRARHWVEENPALAAFLAVGAGIVIGKLLSKAFQPPPPPSFGDRVRQHGRVLSSRAKDVGTVVSERASEAGHQLVRQAGAASKNVSRHARELGDVVARRAEEIAETASEQAAELGDVLAERSYGAARTLRKQASHAASEAKETASEGLSWAESAVNAAKTVAAAYVVKRVTDWVRRAA